jgi:hypothetical protein
MNNMTHEEAMKLAEEVFDEEYSGLDKDSFLIGFQEAFNALTALYKDKFELVRLMREAQKERKTLSSKLTFLTEEDTRIRANSIRKATSLESEVDEYLKKMEV